MVFSEDSRFLPNREVYVSDFVEEELATSNVTCVSHNGELISAFAKYLECETYLDVTLICANNQIIQAHKLVLTAVSPFLKEMLENWEGPQNEIYITLPDISFRIMKLVLDFFYLGHMNLEMDEIGEFKSALNVLRVQIQDATITKSSVNPSVRPPKLMILDSKQKRELGKKNRQPKIVEAVSLASLYVSNEVNAEEEEPIIDMNDAVEPNVSSKANSIDPENDPLNVPDFYYVPSTPLQQQKKITKEPNPVTPESISNQPKENGVRESSLIDSQPAATPKSSKKKSKTSSGNPKSHAVKKKAPTDPEKQQKSKSEKSNLKIKSPQRSEKPPQKKKSSSEAEKKDKTVGHSSRVQQSDKLSVSTPAPAAATAAPVLEPSVPNDAQDDDPIGWLYKLKKEDLVEQLQQFDLDTSGSIVVLRSRLSYYLQHELQSARDSPPPVATSTPNQVSERKPGDKTDRSVKTPSLKRKQPGSDIAIGLKQPRLVIRDVKDDVNLNERMRISVLPGAVRSPSRLGEAVESGPSASEVSPALAVPFQNKSNKPPKKTKDPSFRQLNLSDNRKPTMKTPARRKTIVVPTSTPM